MPRLLAKPRRLEENVDGALYVNDRCINCAACSNFAPQSFVRHDRDAYHVVYQQPRTVEEMVQARAALAACPVAAIRLETKAERQHRAKPGETISWTDRDQQVVDGLRIGGKGDKEPPFPRPFLDNVQDVYWMGHHNEKSFGATPYMLKAMYKQRSVWIMVDTPRFGPSAQRAVESLAGPPGPDYLFLTHVDDTAHHQKWVEQYPALQRIFHAGDLGRHNWLGDQTLEHVEILLQKPAASNAKGLKAYSLDGQELDEDWQDSYAEELVILHTPGHSPGSITLYRRSSGDRQPGILFTGDSYGWTTRQGGRMTGFGRYGNNLREQAEMLKHLVDLDWQVIAPGHGHPRDYRSIKSNDEREIVQKEDLNIAIEDLTVRRR